MAGNDDLDVVQHPTLGELKFPKDMPMEERNASIQRTLQSRPDIQAPPAVNRPAAPGELDPAIPARKQAEKEQTDYIGRAATTALGGGGLYKVGQEARGLTPIIKAIAERPAIAPYVKGAGILAKSAGELPVVGGVIKAGKVLGEFGDLLRKKPVFPGAPFPEHPGIFPGASLPESPPIDIQQGGALRHLPPTKAIPIAESGEALGVPIKAVPKPIFPGAPLPEHPGVFPGAPLPETPSTSILQAAPLSRLPATKAIAASETGEALGALPKPVEAVPVNVKPKTLQDLIEKGTGGQPLKPNVSLREQATTGITEAAEKVHRNPMEAAHGKAMFEAAKAEPETMRAIHELTRVDLRQALINSGEDMGQKIVTNSKFAGGEGITREEAFNLLLKKGYTPKQIVSLAKRPIAVAKAVAAD